VQALTDADVIACEDTRVTRKLLSHAGITGRRLIAVHEHNEAASAARLVGLAAEGQTIAVVSDAGMPGISDPGERLVTAAVEAGVAVEVVPGPSAAITALVLSGLPADRFCFEGFLPRKGGERKRRLAAIAAETRTTVVFEAPHRVVVLALELASACGTDRPVAVARELTKIHEEVWRGTLDEAAAWLDQKEPRGEYVLVIGGAPPVAVDDAAIELALERRLAAGDARRSAVDAVAADLDVPRRRVYEAALRLKT
jgi:16S rRNA (cytidine1402-2'-O)-methyltransferase